MSDEERRDKEGLAIHHHLEGDVGHDGMHVRIEHVRG